MASIDVFSDSNYFEVSEEKLAELGDLLYVTDEDRARYKEAADRIEKMHFDADVKNFFEIAGDLFIKGAVLPEAGQKAKIEDKKRMFTNVLVDFAMFSPSHFSENWMKEVYDKIKSNSDIANLSSFVTSSKEEENYEVDYVHTLLEENTTLDTMVNLFESYMNINNEGFEKKELERFCLSVVSIVCAINDATGINYSPIRPSGSMDEVRGPFDVEALRYFTGEFNTPNPKELQEEIRKVAVDALPTDPNEITEEDIITAEYERNDTLKLEQKRIAHQRIIDFEETTLDDFSRLYFSLPPKVREYKLNEYTDFMQKIAYFKSKIQYLISIDGESVEISILMNKFDKLVADMRTSLEEYAALNESEDGYVFMDFTGYVQNKEAVTIEEFGPTLDDMGNLIIRPEVDGEMSLQRDNVDGSVPEYIRLSLELDQGNEGQIRSVETQNFKTSNNTGINTDQPDGLLEAEFFMEDGDRISREGTIVEKPFMLEEE
jgi:hypothetical protein